MDALTSSCSKKIIASSSYGRNGASFCKARLLGPAEIRFVRSLKLDSGFSIYRQSIFLLQKPIRSSSSLSAPAEVDSENVETQTQLSHQSKTVHVKFELQRACQFGEQFFLTGDDPIFGLWDPANAILLDWSEGHVWTIGLDIPIGKTIQFKFILKGINGEILWQPGPDRCFQTWETENTIIIFEDWEYADLQKVTEEPLADLIDVSEANATGELLVNLAEESMANLTKEPNQESMANLTREPNLVEHVAGSNIGAVNNENWISVEDAKIPISHGGPVLVPGLTATPAPISSTEEPNQESMANLTREPNLVEHVAGSNIRAVNNENWIRVEDAKSPISHGGPVLVPGLTPTPAPISSTEEAFFKEVTNRMVTDASVAADEATNRDTPEKN
ncbi:uncharacterized protein LOC131243993 isoform X2 [Magnolia sinica]|uniref:uncharacterized protein LOC131243993 isoform X2 n=1 Tax=Magnolia sinica TaxID=86752 RepID=UPI00265AA35E|nr:uncharacterized protein LOC131243993 isoform X2 [Magnolia sinica]